MGCQIGEGGLGLVFKATHKETGEVVAIKAMKKQQLLDLKQVTHVKDERQLLEELDHPFVVDFKGAFQDAKFTYFVTEYLPCGELFDLLKEAYVISELESTFYASQIVLTL